MCVCVKRNSPSKHVQTQLSRTLPSVEHKPPPNHSSCLPKYWFDDAVIKATIYKTVTVLRSVNFF